MQVLQFGNNFRNAMKKLIYTLIALSLVAFTACNKLGNTPNVRLEPAPAPESFTVNVPGSYETKTTLDGLKPKWVTGDEIRVYGHNTVSGTYTDNAVYELKSGNGEGTAVFTLKSGETGLSDTYDEFYAVYPSNLTISGLPDNITLPRLNTSPSHMRGQNPAAGQIDPKLAIMTAKYDGSTMSFRHGVSYIKLTIPDDGVTKVDINFTNNCLADTPTYNASTGALLSVANSAKNITSAEGTFVQGESYYFAAIPRSGYAPTTTVITLTGGGTYSTTHFTKLPEIGKVYDLGCPAKNPYITASNVDIAQDATGGNIAFTIGNPAGDGVISIAETGGKTNPADFVLNTTLQTDHFEFTCDANASADARKFYVTLTYTYNSGADEFTKDVVITQAGSAKETHIWDFATYTDEQMTAITGLAADAKATAGQTWDFGDGLTMITNGSSKWNNQTISEVNYKWVATGGKYGSGQKYFSFTTAHVGTVTVLYASGGAASRALTVKVGSTETTDSANVSTSTSDLKTVTFSSVAAGTVMLYSKDDNVRVFSISFLED